MDSNILGYFMGIGMHTINECYNLHVQFFVFLIVAFIGKKLRAHLSLDIVEQIFYSKQYKFTNYLIIFG